VTSLEAGVNFNLCLAVRYLDLIWEWSPYLAVINQVDITKKSEGTEENTAFGQIPVEFFKVTGDQINGNVRLEGL
jgi:hypothetical protein